MFSKISKHESVEAKNVSSKELDLICMTHFIHMNLGITCTIHNVSTVFLGHIAAITVTRACGMVSWADRQTDRQAL